MSGALAPAGASPPGTARPDGVVSVAEAVTRAADLNLTPATLAQHLDAAHYLMTELGALAHKTAVTRTDVVKAAAAAVDAHKISATDGIELVLGMPQEPDDLRPWLQNLYHASMVWVVALYAHAHTMIGEPVGMVQ